VLIVSPFIGYLVRYLKTLFCRELEDRGRPRYLTDEVVQIPAAALAALRKETIHLFDKSLETIVHALNLHRSDIFSSEDIETVVARSNSTINVDVDQVYQQDIKNLYGEIIRYASISQTNMDQEGTNDVYELQLTARKIIEMIKDVRELQKNLSFYGKSNGTVILEKYNDLREELISVLRKIQEIRENQGDEEDILTQIETQKDVLAESEFALNHEVDAMIRENKIDSKTASSLINDIGFAHSISKKLLDSAITLWVRDKELKELGESYENP
jgi:phosphate:Na+ symporter